LTTDEVLTPDQIEWRKKWKAFEKEEDDTVKLLRSSFQAPKCKNCYHEDPDYTSLGVNGDGIIKLKCVHCGAISVKD